MSSTSVQLIFQRKERIVVERLDVIAKVSPLLLTEMYGNSPIANIVITRRVYTSNIVVEESRKISTYNFQ